MSDAQTQTIFIGVKSYVLLQSTLLDKLEDLTKRISTQTAQGRNSETRHVREGYRLLLSCITNIMDSSSSRLLTANLSATFDEDEEVYLK